MNNTIEHYTIAYCRHFNVELSDLQASQLHRYALLRKCLFYHLLFRFKFSNSQISEYFNFDHATVSYHVKSFQAMIAVNDPAAVNLFNLTNKIDFTIK
jgi:chromosomal replication initiation ATPase DnaA